MADPLRDSDPTDADGPGRGAPPPTPRWVKVLGAIGLILVLLLILGLLTGRHHGPGRHFPGREAPSGNGGPHTPTEGGRP